MPAALTPDSVLEKVQKLLSSRQDDRSQRLLAWMQTHRTRLYKFVEDRLDAKEGLAHALDKLDDKYADVYDLFLYSPGPALQAGRSFEFSPATLPALFSDRDKHKVRAIIRSGKNPEWMDETQAKWLLIALTSDGALKRVTEAGVAKTLYVRKDEQSQDETEQKIADWFDRGARAMLSMPRMSDEDRAWVRSVNAEILGSRDTEFLRLVANYRPIKPMRVKPPFAEHAERRLEALLGYTRWIRKDELKREDGKDKNIAIGTTVRVIAGAHKDLVGVTIESGTNSHKAKAAVGTTQAWRVEFPPTEP
jgi:hypothetical protein